MYTPNVVQPFRGGGGPGFITQNLYCSWSCFERDGRGTTTTQKKG